MRFVSNLCWQISMSSSAVGHLTGDTETHAAITFQRQIITLILLFICMFINFLQYTLNLRQLKQLKLTINTRNTEEKSSSFPP